jgi:alcohol dehydrogenase (cytochrome c)
MLHLKSLLAAASVLLAAGSALAATADGAWPSYNRTLASDRFSPLSEIDVKTVTGLKVLCVYDTGQSNGFQTGLIEVGGALYGTTEKDIFSLNPDTCKENWRVREPIKLDSYLAVNRGLAYLDGRLFRGFQDGSVAAYDAKSGRRLWVAQIADAAKGESAPAAPIAWNGLVFIGNAGGDSKGVKGRMYALNAVTGRIVWEAYLVPKAATDVPRGPVAPPAPAGAAKTWNNPPGFPITGGATWTSYTLDAKRGLLYVPGGNPAPDFVNSYRQGDNLYTGSVVVLNARTGAYVRHFQLVPHDFHDYDVSTAPALVTTRGGKRLMAVAPKDGHLYGYDLATGKRLYREAVTRVLNADVPLGRQDVRFCPGAQGGAEWNGPAYDPATNLVFTGEVDWCASVKAASKDKLASVALGQAWGGADTDNPKDAFGTFDPVSAWAGWMTASDADTGQPSWKFKAPAPLMGGVTPTAGGVLFFGDMAGTLYAFDSAKGVQLWAQKIGGAIGGGVISYAGTGGSQRVAAATGMTSPIWPTEKTTAKVVVLGLR